ncbi:hypothetical protein ACFL0K_00585 [Patescibacteria group bacterium]
MKKKILIAFFSALMFMGLPALAGDLCQTIKSGAIVGSDGNIVEVGYDQWGYNYQARMFNGGYCNAYRDASWCHEYADIDLMMKWNDAWLSNMDCGFDGTLDRHRGYNTYIDSGAWLTNHQSGEVEVNGKMRKWTYFVKIIAVTSEDTQSGGNWYRPDGTLIGPVIWGSFATVQEVSNDPSNGQKGVLYKAPAGGTGLGNLEGQ